MSAMPRHLNPSKSVRRHQTSAFSFSPTILNNAKKHNVPNKSIPTRSSPMGTIHEVWKSSAGMESEEADDLGCNVNLACSAELIGIAMIDHTYTELPDERGEYA